MEFVAQAQAMLAENVMYVGIGLFVAVVLAGFVWFYMSSGSKSSSASTAVLENQARIEVADMNLPGGMNQPDPVSPSSPTQEEIEKQLASIGNMNAGQTAQAAESETDE
jgi:hypothetical protein